MRRIRCRDCVPRTGREPRATSWLSGLKPAVVCTLPWQSTSQPRASRAGRAIVSCRPVLAGRAAAASDSGGRASGEQQGAADRSRETSRRMNAGLAHRTSRRWSCVHAAEGKQVLQSRDRDDRPAGHAAMREIGELRVSCDSARETSRGVKAGPGGARGGASACPCQKKSRAFGPTVTTTSGPMAWRDPQVANLRAQPILAKRPLSPRKSGAMDPSRRTRRLVHASEGKRVFRSDAHDERRIENAPGRTEAICGTREAGRPRPGFGLARVCLRTGPFVAAPILRSHQRDRVRPRSTTLLLRDTSKRATARHVATASGASASLLCTPRAGRAAVAFGLPACPTLV